MTDKVNSETDKNMMSDQRTVTEQTYLEFADKPDDEVQQWQRIMRVNKQMLDLGVRETIETLIEPVYIH